MKIEIEPTTKIVDVAVHGPNAVKARVWQGKTGRGVPVTLLVLRVACDRDEDNSELERELVEQAPPGAGVEAWPSRMLLP